MSVRPSETGFRIAEAPTALLGAVGILLLQGCGDAVIWAPLNQRMVSVAFVAQPSDVVAGDTIHPAITVEIRDSAGKRVQTATVAVTLTIGANPGVATLSGSLTVTATNGLATFDDLWLDRAASGYTLAASAATLTPDTSALFIVAPGPPLLAFVSQPDTEEGQVPFDPVVAIAAEEDRFGNVVPDMPVSISMAVNPSGDSLRGTTTVMTANGMATFGDLNLALPGDGLVLEATSGAATPVRSAAFSVRLTFAQVSAGDSHTCGVTVAQFAYCWGATYDFTPTPVAGGMRFLDVSAGTDYTCGVITSGAAYCWGFNFQGELGDGTQIARGNPTPVAGGLTFIQVSAGSGYTCGVTTGHAAYCWGSNGLGQLGDGTTNAHLTPNLVGGSHSFAQVSVGHLGHTCGATTSHEGYCWGNNTTGQLGDSSASHRYVPALVAGALAFTQVSAGGEHSCGVTTGNAVYCWGANGDGQLGDNTTDLRIFPTPVAGGMTFVTVTAGAFRHTCGLTTGTDVSCWGFGAFGQLGNGVAGRQLEPTLVTGGLSFAQVSAGVYHTCGVTIGHQAYCWGINGSGQIGDGTADQRLLPTRVVQ